MRSAILLTTYNRPHYLEKVLESWQHVRHFQEWPLHVFVEPSEEMPQIIGMLESLDHPNMHIHINPTIYGVLHNPWVGFETLFREEHFEFVVRVEDDLLVSDDILEFFAFQAEKWEQRENVYAVLGFTNENGDDDAYRLVPNFSPLIWGTWWYIWQDKIGPSWDHDYSTYNHTPGHQAGWDWNLNTRIYPADGALSVAPTSTRVKDIGEFGVHANGTLTDDGGGFKAHREQTDYREAEGNRHE